MKMIWSQVCTRRLIRQGLAEPVPSAKLAEQVGRICGAHAQIMTAAELSIGLRTADTTRSDVQRALWTDRHLVKTYGPRGTVHVLYAEDLPMWTGALSAIPAARNPNAKDVLLTPEQTAIVLDAIGEILSDTEMTADELTDALVEHLGEWVGEPVMEAFQTKWPRWRYAMGDAANRGALCFGPDRGRRVTYTNPHRWLPGFRPAKGETAQADLLKRYLYTYGPATPQQFARWLGAPPRWAVELFDRLGDALEAVELNGQTAWLVAGDTEMPDDKPEGLWLLPYFDVYTVGSYPRELLFPGRASERALAGGQAGNYPILLIDGLVAGVWHQKRSGKKLKITVEPLTDLTAGQRRALDDEVQRIGLIQEAVPEMTIGRITVGPHA